ncbi:MAG: glutamine amidotransferase-like uncharacterized protein [Verrucomicrobiales bacterium]|jgi:glutamine amidotransferase-like uncharacterized protein
MMKTFFTLLLLFFPLLTQAAETSGVLAEGTKWETRFYIIDSGVDGPTVVVTGGVHGNEPAGFRAAEQIRHWPIASGKLVVVPQVNVLGLRAKTRYLPDASDEERDLNRNFPVVDGEAKPRGELATEIWSFVRDQKPDWILDLHEGYEYNVSHKPPEGKKKSVGSTIIYFKGEARDPVVERALEAVNSQIKNPWKRFRPLTRGPISGSLARACATALGAEAMILETTYKEQPISLRTRQHRAMANVLLNHIGLIDRDCSNLLTPGREAEQLLVGFFDGPGVGPSGKENIPRIADKAEKIDIHFLGAADIRPEVLSQFDLLIFPGGSGSKQAKAIGEGREHVREFVETGGGYLGICAGAYLCSAHYSWSLDLVDSSVFTGSREIEGVGKKQMWYRGEGARIDLELTEAGSTIFSSVPTEFDVHFQNGPIISPKNAPEIEDYQILAWFRSEQVRWEPQRGTMVDTPAIVSCRFGEGRVISISPHPEKDKALESILVDSIRWAAGK